jgi:histidinol-phosphate aminotransferase
MNRRHWLKRGVAAAVALPLWPSAYDPFLPPRSVGPLRLHNNENPFGMPESARKAVLGAFEDGADYPTRQYEELAAQIAQREGVAPESVVLGAGSGEILRVAGTAYGLAGGEILTGYPTYEGLETHSTRIGAFVHRVPVEAEGMTLDLDAMDRRATQAVKLVFVCNPNNPTGTFVPADRLSAFCETISRRTVVLVDEAYHEFANDPRYASMVPLVRAGENVIISRTFSKIYGLAGLRVGYALARPDIADRLRRYTTIGGVNLVGVAAARAAYEDTAFVARTRDENGAARAYVNELFTTAGRRVLPSQTNFVFFELGFDVRTFQKTMADRGILVGRPFPPYTDWCRVSLGTVEEMQRFAGALDGAL